MMAESKTYKQIAEKMNISTKTVETHIRHISNKTISNNLNGIFEFIKILKGKYAYETKNQ